MSQELSFIFRPAISRRIPDPVFKKTLNAERHLFMMPVRQIPRDLPLDPNARRPNIRRRVYQKVLESLLNEDCEHNTFHLKNKGITLIAQSVDQIGDGEFKVSLKRGLHGIVDGGHTYTLIVENQDNAALPEQQFVEVEIRTGVPDHWIAEIAGGLNTSVQVQDMSLDNLSGLFSWIKDDLRAKPYFKAIAWSENDPGEFDARDIISLMTMFNVELFPNDQDEHPVLAYEKKSNALKLFEEKGDSYKRMRPILGDILRLHDTVRFEARKIWNDATHGKGGALSFMEKRKKGSFEFPFISASGEYRLVNGALYPMLAAFRWYVKLDPTTGRMTWRDGFKSVLDAWHVIGPELLKATYQASIELGRNPNALGKSRNHWANLHTRLAKHDLLSRQSA